MPSERRRWHIAAALLYLAASWLYLDHGASLTGRILGQGADPYLIIWFLAYWPWAELHHIYNLHTQLVWQPHGLNLAWTTCVPLLALLGWPATLLGGPVLAFDLLMLAAPASAAFAAYLLCLDLSAVPAAALLGGFLYGFSSFEAAQSYDHLNLAVTCLIPLTLMLALRFARGAISRNRISLLLGLLLAAQFYVSPEMLAFCALFGGLGMALAFLLLSADLPRLRALLAAILRAAPYALVLAAPLLIGMIFGPYDIAHKRDWPENFSIDLLNFVIPTQASLVGGAPAAGLSRHFTGGLDEQTGYLGPVLLLLLAFAWWEGRATPRQRLLYALLGIALLLSLGPRLHIAGHGTSLPLPWALIAPLPLLGAALPARAMLFAFLIAAILVCLWVARRPGARRILFATAACVSLAPAPHATMKRPDLAFFRPGEVQRVLGPNPRLLVLPFGINGGAPYWQAENRFGYSEVGGYLGYPPRAAQAEPAVMQLFANVFFPDFAQDFVTLCTITGAQYVIAAPGTPAAPRAVLNRLGWPRRDIDGVAIYTVPGAADGG